jgi:hypothetical protein
LYLSEYFLGPWLHAQLNHRADRLAAPSHEVSSRRVYPRQVLRALPPLLAFPAVWTADIASAISVEDNRRFLKAEKAHARELGFPESPADDKSIEVAHLSSGLLRYRVVNPQAKRLVLGFHGFQESLEEFPPVLDHVEKLGYPVYFIDRPGIGPVSTPWPGLDLVAWAHLVEESTE